MTYKEDIDSQVDDYAAIFDLYIEQGKGTRFYGLAIGGDAGAYRKYLDKYWTI